ncbi:hypothetical protein HanIR_Chr15g0741731 [Helianthus annuus]|nr:hypothetical protein HanIR_Chr15g0741731 [Helianthus annuus]
MCLTNNNHLENTIFKKTPRYLCLCRTRATKVTRFITRKLTKQVINLTRLHVIRKSSNEQRTNFVLKRRRIQRRSVRCEWRLLLLLVVGVVVVVRRYGGRWWWLRRSRWRRGWVVVGVLRRL